MRRLVHLAAAFVVGLACCSGPDESARSSSAAIQSDIGGSRSDGPSVIDSTVGVPPGGGGGAPGGPPGFCYFTEIVGAFVRDTDYIKIDIDDKPTGAVWALYQSGGPTSPYATAHCITLDSFTGIDPNTYTTMRIGPGTAVQTGPTEVLIGIAPEWPGPPPPPPPIPSNFNFMGWVDGHLSTAGSATWVYYGVPFGPDPNNQHARGGCYVDEDSQPASGCGGSCTLTGNCWSFGGNTWISATHYGNLNLGTFQGWPLDSVATSICGISGISGDWSSPTTFASITQSNGQWVANGGTGGGAGEQFEYVCYPLAQ
jgi:hypothetical protein